MNNKKLNKTILVGLDRKEEIFRNNNKKLT